MRNMSHVHLARLLIVFIAALLGTACSAGATAQQIIGSWQSDDGAGFQFDADSSFTASGLRNELFDDFNSTGTSHSGAGKWSFGGGRPCVTATFTDVSSLDRENVLPMDRPLYCSGAGPTLRIYFIIGDPDDHNYYYFHKVLQTVR